MFAIALILVVLSSGWSLTRSVRRGQLSIDVIALIAMVGALALDEYLAAAVIAVMLAGGNALEAAATGRAKRELTALVARAPRTARRRRGDRSRRSPSMLWSSVTSSSFAAARSSPSTVSSSPARRSSTKHP
jgi:cation transport ATPase